MKGDISLAGFLLTAQEWQAFEPSAREQLIAAASRRDGARGGAPPADAPGEPAADDEGARA